MSSFLDNKEEVIKLELTTYGKKLLAQGQFKPEFYAFFDDGIVYDLAYIGTTENQNSTQGRILDDFISLPLLNIGAKSLSNSLGNSAVDSDYAPSWDLKVLKGNISYISQSSSYEEKIFSSSVINYSLELKNSNVFLNTVPNLSNFEFTNGKTLIVKDDYILLDLQQFNVEEEYKNFEVEVFLEDPEAEDNLRQLSFLKKKNNVIDDIIYDDNELPRNFRADELTSNNVELFLDVLVDEEIDRNIIEGAAIVQEDITKVVADVYAVKDEC
jgi:hypothetical protein